MRANNSATLCTLNRCSRSKWAYQPAFALFSFTFLCASHFVHLSVRTFVRSFASLTFSRFVSFRSSAPEVDVPFVLCFALAFFFVFCHGQHRRLGFGRVYAMRVWVCFTNEFSTQTWTTMLRFFGLNLSTDSAESKWEAVLGSLNLWFFSFLHWRRFFFLTQNLK